MGERRGCVYCTSLPIRRSRTIAFRRTPLRAGAGICVSVWGFRRDSSPSPWLPLTAVPLCHQPWLCRYLICCSSTFLVKPLSHGFGTIFHASLITKTCFGRYTTHVWKLQLGARPTKTH